MGRRQAARQRILIQLATHFYLGDSSGALPCTPGPCTRPHLDRVDIYDHAISDELVKALGARTTGICPGSSDPHPVLSYTIHPSLNTLTARVELDDLAHQADHVVFWRMQAVSIVGASQIAPIRWSAAETTLPAGDLSPGDFELHATIIRENGPPIDLPAHTITKPDTSAWAGTSLGLGSTPPGWAPLQVRVGVRHGFRERTRMGTLGKTRIAKVRGLISRR
jgi:hypothetical protein